MSAAVIWIFGPLIFSVIFFLLRSRKRWINSAAISITGALALLAFMLPIGIPVKLGLWPGLPPVLIRETFNMPGAVLSIGNSFRPILGIIYLFTTAWYIGNLAETNASSFFVPLSLAATAAGCAASAVRPAEYSHLVGFCAAILCLPLILDQNDRLGNGPRRFIISQTMGAGVLILAKLLMPLSMETGSSALPRLIPIGFVAIGFALILPVFPFHSYVVLSVKETRLYQVFFTFCWIGLFNTILLNNDLASTADQAANDLMLRGLLAFGSGMILLGGIWAFFEKKLGRILGFAFIQQIGAVLLFLRADNAVQTQAGIPPAIIYFLPLSLAFILCSLSVETIGLRYDHSTNSEFINYWRAFPISMSGFLIGLFSLTGIPPLSGFPWLQRLLFETGQEMAAASIAAISGFLLMMVTTLRLVDRPSEQTGSKQPIDREHLLRLAVTGFFVILIIMLGIFPRIYDIFLLATAE